MITLEYMNRVLSASMGNFHTKITALMFMCMMFFAAAAFSQPPEMYLQLGYKTGSDFNYGQELAFLPDGNLFAAVSGGNTIRIWETGTGREVQTLVGHGRSIKSLAFLPDNRRIVSGDNDNTVKLWDINSARQLRLFSGHRDGIRYLAVSSDGSLLASMERKALKLWNINTGSLLATIPPPVEPDSTSGYAPPLVAAAFTRDNLKLIFTNLRAEVFMWGIKEQRITSKFAYAQTRSFSSQNILGFTSNGKAILGGVSALVVIDPASGAVANKNFKDAGMYVEYMSPDESMIVSRSWSPQAIHVFDANLKKRLTIPLDEGVTCTGYLSSSNQVAVSTMDNQLKLYDLETGKELQNFSAKAFTQNNGRFSRDGAYISLNVQIPVKNVPVKRTDTWTNTWNLKTADRERLFNITELHEKLNKMFASGDAAQRERASRIVAQNNFYEAPKEITSDYDELNGCFYRVGSEPAVGPMIGSPLITIYRIVPKDKYDFAATLYDNRSKWKILKRFKAHDQNVSATAVTYKHGYLATGSWDKTIKLFSFPGLALIRSFQGHTAEITELTFSPDGTRLLSQSADQTTRIWDVATGKELARFINFTDGEWIVITPEGYYNASPNGDRYLNVRVGNNIYGIENYREAFFRPDLVKVSLSGGSLQEFRTLADVKQPPTVSIVETPRNIKTENVTVKLRLTDNGGGIGDIRLYLNGTAVVMDSRAVTIIPKDDKALFKEYTLKLISGRNIIKATAFNSGNTMQSNEAMLEVTASFAAAGKPSLYALVIGINEFKNPKLKLNYPVADAELFAATLKKVSAGLFNKVDVKKLTTMETTTNTAIIREIKFLKSLNPDDLFVFYIASHGTVDDGEYFLITSNVGSLRTEKLKTDAISQNMLKEAIANIPATKKLIIIDTCNAGALGEAIQTAMLTRGMSEDTALKILSRAVGSTILSASTSVQEALEGYRGHGLFTYVLTEGLKGKADKGKTGYIRTTELADYVDNEVPILAEKVFRRAQYPTISISGQAFPVGKVK